jgi:copper transport protein
MWAVSDAGHAATGGDATLNVAIDLIHQLATAAWLGGLVGLAVLAIPAALGLPEADRVRLAAAVVVRFSALALTAVALLVVTGVYRALAEVSVDDLLDTGYGRALLVKLGLFAVLLVGGAYNRMVVHPRLERAALGLDPGDRGAAAALRVSVRAELALAAALMVSVAVLVSLAPPG